MSTRQQMKELRYARNTLLANLVIAFPIIVIASGSFSCHFSCNRSRVFPECTLTSYRSVCARKEVRETYLRTSISPSSPKGPVTNRATAALNFRPMMSAKG